ncbi:sulfite exporter TauE/SafE family protein [Amphritea sp. 1_MG-2023]|uniref:sulfite exporter TauE/SafE family protein n=1 Tax=Amphritea sp. 1_MG-2023 TaxID=3062670 RepID=UPI0026E314EC|nr:sulfite exporter TauE/SafE family protein [Amphritea sp. 1_MG-2023]MDO6563600.1 sulfite exporter TauE/SafE family protein [Amphritea sp. 1_MG-2023]
MPHLELAMLLVLLAALVRGYTGFGFAAIAISGLSLIWPAQISVPVILIIDAIGSIGMLASAWKFADRKLLKNLSLGAIVGLPLGLTVLIQVPDSMLKFAISSAILCMALWILFARNIKINPAEWHTRIIGSISGAFTAAASVGGLPIVCYLLMTHHVALVQRATMVIFLSSTDLISIGLMAGNGMITSALLQPTLLLLIPALIGVQCGQWFFHRKPPLSFRPIALPVLMLLSTVSIYYSGLSILN